MVVPLVESALTYRSLVAALDGRRVTAEERAGRGRLRRGGGGVHTVEVGEASGR